MTRVERETLKALADRLIKHIGHGREKAEQGLGFSFCIGFLEGGLIEAATELRALAAKP